MKVYRSTLVWALRAGAVAILTFAAWNFMQMRQAAASALGAAEAAGLSETAFAYFAPAAAVALVFLTLAEILSLLLRQRS